MRIVHASTVLSLITISTAMFLSCGKKEKQTTNPDLSTIDLVGGINNSIERLLLSDVSADIEIIPLETSDNSIFNYEDVTNIISTSSGVLIGVGKRILHFDRQGKYIGDIGKFGN